MLKLIPTSWFSWDFRVMQDGRELSLIDRHWFHERASFTIGSRTYDVRRTSVLRGTFVLEQDGAVVAEAVKPSSLERRFELTVGGEQYTLEAVSMLRREFRLRRGNVPLGGVRADSVMRRNATAQFVSQIPAEVQLFVVFLVLVLWKRAADAAAAGG